MRAALVSLAVVLAASACTGSSPDDPKLPDVLVSGGTLRIASFSDIDAMDPAQMHSDVSWFLARGVYRTLVTFPAQEEGETSDPTRLVPDLAVGLGSHNDDFTEWTYTLRNDVTYGPAIGGSRVLKVTGEPIACEDFKYAFDRMFNGTVGVAYPELFQIIKGADKYSRGLSSSISGIDCDGRSLTFKLSEPAGDWDLRMAMPAASPVPIGAAESHDASGNGRTYNDYVVATGPYYVEEWRPGERIILVRNDNWSPPSDTARAAFVDRVEWRVGVGFESVVPEVVEGDADLAVGLGLSEPFMRGADDATTVLAGSNGCTRYIFLNTRIPPFDDPDVRRAVALAVDKAALKGFIGGGITGPVATSVVPPGVDGYLSPNRFDPYKTAGRSGDLDAARKLFREAIGQSTWDGRVKLVGPTPISPDLSTDIGESVRDDLEALGFTNVVIADGGQTYYAVPGADVAVGTGAKWCADYPSGAGLFDPSFRSDQILPVDNQNYAEVNDPVLDDMITAAEGAAPGAEQTEAWEKVNRYATELAAWVPWSWDATAIPYNEHLNNVQYLGFINNVDWVNVALGGAES